MYSATSKLGNADGLEASIDSATRGLVNDRQVLGNRHRQYLLVVRLRGGADAPEGRPEDGLKP